jgi:hypothetical protein
MKHICQKSILNKPLFRSPYTLIFMNKRFTLFLFFLLLGLAPINSFSQTATASTNPVLFVKCDDLTVENHTVLYKLIKTDARMKIKKSCVPGHILMIEVISQDAASLSSDAQIDLFKGFATSAGILQVQTLNNYTLQMFDETCATFRGGH